MGKLRDRMIEEMKLRNFAPATQRSYVYAVSRLARYHKRSPDQLGKEEIRGSLVISGLSYPYARSVPEQEFPLSTSILLKRRWTKPLRGGVRRVQSHHFS